MPRGKRGPLNLGGGRYVNRGQAKRKGMTLLSAGTMGKRTYTKKARSGSSLKRAVRVGGARKSVSKGGQRMIVGSSAWNSSRYRRNKWR